MIGALMGLSTVSMNLIERVLLNHRATWNVESAAARLTQPWHTLLWLDDVG